MKNSNASYRKVDVVVNVYGKPFQTVATLKSLFDQSGDYIERVILIIERSQPEVINILNMVRAIPKSCVFIPTFYRFQFSTVNLDNSAERLSVRYQFAFENASSRYLFITHNDVLYTGNVIKAYLDLIEGAVGVGQIGQCWNCPGSFSGLCSGETFGQWIPDNEAVSKLKLPYARTTISNIDRNRPFPLPECRLNEWACLVDREQVNEESIKKRRVPLFGLADGVDIGTSWFRGMHLLGYRFVHSTFGYQHGFWAETTAGFGADSDRILYDYGEQRAKEFLETGRLPIGGGKL